ncbi:hypothetical protein EV426DRAFT_719357 [Tirmania nivea]|nr:hypothetical protein EV426DRAFT_719357 [Tirmania nivea]
MGEVVWRGLVLGHLTRARAESRRTASPQGLALPHLAFQKLYTLRGTHTYLPQQATTNQRQPPHRMGRLAGFASGIILTLTATHLLTQHLHRTTAHNSTTLRQTTLVANSVLSPRVPITPLGAYTARPSFTETMKDMWNEEVERGVRWVQGWDLRKAREDAEEVIWAVAGKVRRELEKERGK